MKPETRTLGIGILSFVAFLLSNLFPQLLPSIGNFLQSTGPPIWVILFLVMILIVQTAFLLQKRKH